MGPAHTRPERDLKIWIDADAAPRDVKELVFRAAKRLGLETVLVANRRLQTPPGNPMVTAVWVDGGADVADQHIASHAAPGDLVVTQDVPLAALLVPKGVAVLDLGVTSIRPRPSASGCRCGISWSRRASRVWSPADRRPTTLERSRPLPQPWIGC